MKNKQIRRIIVLIMCLVFVFNLAASAYAISTGGVWSSVSLPADVGVSSVMNGLGVLPGENSDAYDGIVERCVDYLTEQGRVVAGKINAWKRDQVDGTPWQYGIDVPFIDVIRAWLYDSDTVKATETSSMSISLYYDNGSNIFAADNSIMAFGVYHPNQDGNNCDITFCSGANPAQIDVYWQGNLWNHTFTKYDSQVEGYFTHYTSRPVSDITGLSFIYTVSDGFTKTDAYEDALAHFGTVGISTDLDLTLGEITAPYVSLAESYPIWYSNSIAVSSVELGGSETDDDVLVYPFAPGDTLADTQVKTQEEVWAGAGSITDTPAIPDTVTLSDILSGILSIPQAIVGSIAQALANFFGISGTADAYAISLTDFFPFCIPFDIYDFLSVLSAEPEAPVFHWEIPVPQLGRTFDIDVDLSPWDPVAAVFRTFELLAFIVGLGMVTREKFLRS